VRGLSKRFGGIVAVDDLSFELQPGLITALVGPNGAGKTTVFNLLTGVVRPDSGVVLLHGQDVTGKRLDQVTRLGMARSFQDVRVHVRLSALENVMLGVQGQPGEHLGSLLLSPASVRRHEREARERAMDCLAFVGLADAAAMPAGALAFGQQKLVALARVLATQAQVLLLDEPASGIDVRWVDPMLDLVAEFRAQGKTVCIVEHNLHVVQQLADTVCFMELGRVTARGPIRELMRDERLAEAYFGTP
jgi:branched-chain amino acid transport system permease protein